MTLGLKIASAEPSALGAISILKGAAAEAEFKTASVEKVNNLSALFHRMSVPKGENKIEGILTAKKGIRA